MWRRTSQVLSMMVGIRMSAPQLSEVEAILATADFTPPRSVARCKHEMHRELQPVRGLSVEPCCCFKISVGKIL